MRVIRRHLLAVAAPACVVALAAPVSGASAQVSPFGTSSIVTATTGPMLCGSVPPTGNGTAGGVFNQSCGVALSFIAPAVGELAAVIGPTIIGSNVAEPITVSAGTVAGP